MKSRHSLIAAVLLLSACGAPSEHLPAPGAMGPYSSGVVAGRMVWLSGKIGAAETRSGPFEKEVESALDAVAAELQSIDLTWRDVVSVTIQLSDINLYGTLNDVYARRVTEPWPARSCYAVSALPGGARLEVTVVARR
jgi:2-iminobutanoate/2-iminopropanoate deaminase